ncbi:pilus assembly protein TadG-related protein [Propionibacteriaceae bacterium Y1685]
MRRNERGGNNSLMAVILAPAMIVAVGLVVDGGGKLSATREAQAVADEAARSGADAGATAEVHGDQPGSIATTAAKAYLADAGVNGTVTVRDGRVHVATTMTYRTKLVSIIGINTLPASGAASAELVTS